LEGLFNMLPALRTGEAIIVGEAVDLPLRALIDAPVKNRRPDSHDPHIYDSESHSGWNPPRKQENYARVLEAWRGEKPKAPNGDN
jgi:hypothetical protein